MPSPCRSLRRRQLGGGAVALLAAVLLAAPAAAQLNVPSSILPGVKLGGSANVRLLSHVPLGGFFRVSDLTIEQDPDRPYVYVAQTLDRAGFTILDVKDPEHARVLYRHRFAGPAPVTGYGATRPQYFKSHGRYYLVVAVQDDPRSPDAGLGALVYDVTSLPDTARIREVARIRAPDGAGGFRGIFAYKHSDERALLFAALDSGQTVIYDLDSVIAGPTHAALVGHVPVPGARSDAGAGYADITVMFDPASHEDRFYGAGRGGFYVYDVTRPASPKLLTSIVGSAGVTDGSTFTPTPDGQFAIAGTGVQYSPLRVFDLRDGLAGRVQTIQRPIGAWTADWRDATHQQVVRWPLAFIASYEDGLQIINLDDPAHPQTAAWYYTCGCAHEAGFGSVADPHGTSVINGAIGVDVRNSDGLIALSDANTGVWLFRLDGFAGWNGPDVGMPNVSTAQDWDRGPLAATGTVNLIP